MDVEDRVRGYVCDALGDCSPDQITAVTRLTGGERHTVYKVSNVVPGRGANDVVVRIARSDDSRDPALAEREARVLEKVKGSAAPLLYDFRCESRWFDVPVTCTQFVAGQQRELTASSPQDLERLGSVVASIHALPADDLIEWFPETTTPGMYLDSRVDIVDGRVAAYVRDPLPTSVQSRLERAVVLTKKTLTRARSAESGGVEQTRVLQHGDVAGGNIIWGDGPVLIDWEYARLGDPADELAYIFSQNALPEPQREAFWRGYRQSTRPDQRLDRVADRVAVTTSLASSRSLAESPTRCGACASTGSSRSVASAPAMTLISRGRPACCDISTVQD